MSKSRMEHCGLFLEEKLQSYHGRKMESLKKRGRTDKKEEGEERVKRGSVHLRSKH